ncbi:DUF3298 and DUF4163 domain-containing protein [Hanstruepera marina]|uniref:DUF3298 and DUF4163 domain-containing protein n=1 Tax=Hanstruepera marina TaxID=2873265 RepID=UPI001CA72D37|nr:DUF3298 and DUF4163 domain-containing protein [Hanstruepera marina]
MRFKYIFLLAFVVISFISCIDDTKVEFSEINITTPKNNIVEINIPKASGVKTVAQNINSTITSGIIDYLKVGDLDTIPKSSVEDAINTFNNEYENFKTDFPESAIEWDAQIDGEVMYHSEVVISIALTAYQNTGGAHGILNISFLNFDVETGKLISNENLFSDFSAFKEFAKEYFKKEIAGNEDQYFEPEKFTMPANIGFDDEGVFLLYNTYEIAPYSTGLTEIHIPFDQVSILLNYM